MESVVGLDLVAVTGWRTDDLLLAISSGHPRSSYDMVTLLIGVNNQFQDRPFTQYETEFPALLKKAVLLTGNDSGRVVVVSIPDYAYTPFEQNLDSDKISEEIDRYNEFAPETASGSGVKYVNITDITRLGLERPELVTRDGLHPSEKAYKLFTDRIFPAVFNKLRN